MKLPNTTLITITTLAAVVAAIPTTHDTSIHDLTTSDTLESRTAEIDIAGNKKQRREEKQHGGMRDTHHHHDHHNDSNSTRASRHRHKDSHVHESKHHSQRPTRTVPFAETQYNVTVPDYIKYAGISRPDGLEVTNSTSLAPRDADHLGTYICCLPEFGGICHWVPLEPNKCQPMWCKQENGYGSSFGPDQGLICTVWTDPGCSGGPHINNWRYGMPYSQNTGTQFWVERAMAHGIRSWKCRQLTFGDGPASSTGDVVMSSSMVVPIRLRDTES